MLFLTNFYRPTTIPEPFLFSKYFELEQGREIQGQTLFILLNMVIM